MNKVGGVYNGPEEKGFKGLETAFDKKPDDLGMVGKARLAPKMARREGKAPISLIPMDILREHVLEAYKEGLLKYEKESWRRGFKISELVDASFRHIESFFYKGEDFDPDSLKDFNIKKHHLAGAIFSLISALHVLEHHPHLDDRRKNTDGDLINETVGGAEQQLPGVGDDSKKDL